MSDRAPDRDPCEPKASSANPMASQVVVGCSRSGLPMCSRRSARGRRRHRIASHASTHSVFEEIPNRSRWVDFRSEVAQGCRMKVRSLR
eukprot:3782013-Pyramimonas_sp.AAC.1